MRDLAYVAVVTLCGVLLVVCARLALTPEFSAALATVGSAIARNVAVRALGITLAVVGLLSLCAAAWDRDDKRREK
jgi:hypothetical protein